MFVNNGALAGAIESRVAKFEVENLIQLLINFDALFNFSAIIIISLCSVPLIVYNSYLHRVEVIP